MSKLPAPEARITRSYLLRLWQEHEGASWRMSVRRSGDETAVGFTSLDELADYLESEIRAPAAHAGNKRQGVVPGME